VKKILSLIVAVTYLGAVLSAPVYAAIKSGSTCSPKGATASAPGIKYTCVKSGNKLIWAKDITPKISLSQSPSQNVKVGDSCVSVNDAPIKLAKSLLYCAKQGDGKNRYIQFNLQIPSVSNPISPKPLSACQPPDLRGDIPEGNFSTAITYPAGPVKLSNKGILRIAVVPIDFSDVPGTQSPLTLYGTDLKKISMWFEAFSNSKLKIQYQTSDKWYRALKTSNYYNVGEGLNTNIEGKSTNQLIQEYIDLTASNFNYSEPDAIIFLYPPETPNINNSFAELLPIKINSGIKTPFEMSIASANRAYGPAWSWIVHEMLHQMGLAMHFPVNPPNWGIEWGGFTSTPVLLPWNQGILDWINSDQYYCAVKESLSNTKLTLLPLENPGKGLHSAFIRISESEVMMIVSHRKGAWSANVSDSFYGSMVAIIDTTKQTSWNGEHSGEDKMDGTLFAKSGVYLHPDRSFATPRVWTRTETGDWGALMLLGDVVSYKGVVVKLVESNNFDTFQISKS
jgi:hypothetical protein